MEQLLAARRRDNETAAPEGVATQDHFREVKEAVESLAEQRQEPDAPPGIDEALKQLSVGDTTAAEKIFREVLDRRKAEGETANKEAARPARHLGALAFLYNTQKALDAYREAVELDPDDPDGWNQLGQILHRIGDLDEAEAAFGCVLGLGNRVEGNRVIAAATGNLGVIHLTRGDLDKSEEFHLKSLALHKELGHKEGMASQYGNLGLIHRRRGDLDKAEELHLKSLALEEDLGRKEGMASDYGNLGLIHRTRGDLDKAEGFHLKSLALYEELGHKEGIANQYGNLGTIRAQRDDTSGACAYWAKAKALFLEIDAKDRVEQVGRAMVGAGCPE